MCALIEDEADCSKRDDERAAAIAAITRSLAPQRRSRFKPEIGAMDASSNSRADCGRFAGSGSQHPLQQVDDRRRDTRGLQLFDRQFVVTCANLFRASCPEIGVWPVSRYQSVTPNE